MLQWWKRSKRDFPWRRQEATKFHRIVSEILLQRTRAETVAAFWPYFLERFPTWNSIAEAEQEEIERMLKAIGLHKQRTPRLKSLAEKIVGAGGEFPRIRTEIESLPGIGQYIANAILLFCFGERQPLLDVNMARVLERYFGPRKLADIRYDPYLQKLSLALVSCNSVIYVNWALLDLGALVCTSRNPDCKACPLSRHCRYVLENKH